MIKSFSEIVERARSKHENRMISNASIEHAGILIRALLVDAVETGSSVKIVTGNLKAPFYSPMADLAKDVMNAGGSVEIIVEDAHAELAGNAFYEAVQAHPNPRNRVMILNADVYKSVSHFVVSGKQCCRLETDHEASEAIANFGDTELASALLDIFTRLESDAQVIEKPAVDFTALPSSRIAASA